MPPAPGRIPNVAPSLDSLVPRPMQRMSHCKPTLLPAPVARPLVLVNGQSLEFRTGVDLLLENGCAVSGKCRIDRCSSLGSRRR